MTYKLTLYGRESGHFYFGLTDNTGNTIYRGFYRGGEIQDETYGNRHALQLAAGKLIPKPITLTEQEYNNALNKLNELESDSPEYWWIGYNCVDFTNEILKAAKGSQYDVGSYYTTAELDTLNDAGWYVDWVYGSSEMVYLVYIDLDDLSVKFNVTKGELVAQNLNILEHQIQPEEDPDHVLVAGGGTHQETFSLPDSTGTWQDYTVVKDGQSIALDNTYHVIIGDSQSETLSYALLTGGNGVTVNLIDQTTTMEGRVGIKDYLGGVVKNVTGSEYNDIIISDNLNRHIIGGNGEDTVDYSSAMQGVNVNFAINNNDTIEGVEYIIGSNLDDVIVTETLNSTIDGAGGNDILVGSSGADVFRFGRADGEDTIEGQNSSSSDRIEIYYNNSSVVDNIAFGVAPSILVGEAKLSDHPTWDYGLTYGGHQAYFNWAGDPEVEGSTGRLVVDFDYNGSNLKDLIIEDFASGHFGIHLEGAEEEDEGDNEGGNPFSTPGSSEFENWITSGVLIDGELVPIWDAVGVDDEIFDGGIVVSSGEEGTGIVGYGADAASSSQDPRTIVAYRETAEGDGFPDADIGAGVIGDPHVVSFDGLFFDFQDTGEFTLARNTDGNSFNVQARMREWDLGDAVGDKFSVNTAIATELNGVKVGFYIKGSLPYDLVAAAADSDTLNDEAPVLYIGDKGYFIPDQGIILVEDGFVYRNGDTYTVINATGDMIQVTVHEDYIDLKTSAPASRQGNVEGLLGNFDGDTSNDFTLDNGTNLGSSISSNTLYNVFGDDWRITQGESLFLYGAGETTSSFDNPDFDNVQRTLADFDSALVSAAQSAAIAEGFDPNSAVFDAAVLDFLVMGYVEHDEIWQELEQKTLVQADISNPSDIIMGTSGNDSMIGTAGKDYMMGLAGNDTIYGRGDNDTIIGGEGDDIIYGEGGIDTYIHIQGDGNDTINSGEPSSADTIIMQDDNGNLLTLENLHFSRATWNSPNLVVTNRLSGESITIINQLAYSGKYIAFVNNIDIRGALSFLGTDASETIHGTSYADTLEGGLGDDVLNGYGGIDIYIHNEGDGNDTINSGEPNSSDTIIMKDANGNLLTEDDLQFVRTSWNSPNLVIVNNTTGESITVINQLAYSGKSIASVNGIDLTNGFNFLGTDAFENIYGTSYADTLEGGLGDDVLNGSSGVDTYIHNEGDGNDTINSGEPNSSDTIIMKDDEGVLLTQDDLQFSKSSLNLLVKNIASGETLTITNQFAYSGKYIASINGIDITGGLKIDGTDAGEIIQGTSYADTLTGGLGSDTIYGSYGADLYIHNEGDGNDYLFSGEVNSSDVISMRDNNGVEIAEVDLLFSQMGWDLVVTHTSSNEVLILEDMYYSTGHTFATLNGIDLDNVL